MFAQIQSSPWKSVWSTDANCILSFDDVILSYEMKESPLVFQMSIS